MKNYICFVTNYETGFGTGYEDAMDYCDEFSEVTRRKILPEDVKPVAEGRDSIWLGSVSARDLDLLNNGMNLLGMKREIEIDEFVEDEILTEGTVFVVEVNLDAIYKHDCDLIRAKRMYPGQNSPWSSVVKAGQSAWKFWRIEIKKDS